MKKGFQKEAVLSEPSRGAGPDARGSPGHQHDSPRASTLASTNPARSARLLIPKDLLRGVLAAVAAMAAMPATADAVTGFGSEFRVSTTVSENEPGRGAAEPQVAA